jgi:hypothetical protein
MMEPRHQLSVKRAIKNSDEQEKERDKVGRGAKSKTSLES